MVNPSLFCRALDDVEIARVLVDALATQNPVRIKRNRKFTRVMRVMIRQRENGEWYGVTPFEQWRIDFCTVDLGRIETSPFRLMFYGEPITTT